MTYYSNDRLRVFDSDFTQHWCSGDLGNPTGLCVPRSDVHYNPLNLSKADDADPVSACDILTYSIYFDNFLNQTNSVDNVVITDAIPDYVSYISASVDEGLVTFDGTTVTWDFGTVDPGAGPYCMELVVEVTGIPGDVITNTCYIDSAIGGTHVVETTDIVVLCGDLDGDCDVDGDDRTIFIGTLRTCTGDPGFIDKADYDNDGYITFKDYREWYKCYKAFLGMVT